MKALWLHYNAYRRNSSHYYRKIKMKFEEYTYIFHQQPLRQLWKIHLINKVDARLKQVSPKHLLNNDHSFKVINRALETFFL